MRNFIGTSGFSYKDWRGRFYPEDLPANKWFLYYTRYFSTVEINSSFYHLPGEKTLLNWRVKAPDNFVFVLKASSYITHRLRLKQVEKPLEIFHSRSRLLGEKLGPVLYQLPPGLHKDLIRLEDFLKLLPHDIKHVVEFRHDSWVNEEVFHLLKEYQVAYCIISAPGFQCCLQATAAFVYIRFHGISNWYNYDYTEEDLTWWANYIKNFNGNQLPVYAYFNNDVGGCAAKNAKSLNGLLENEDL